ncbi:MAG: hypothetical protein HFH68_07355 [Lachnospiraceae bacterium]|nr:hypothetical protein [Lachnospiraceae bacterium]
MEKFKQNLYRFLFCLFCIFFLAVYQEAGCASAASKEDFAEIKNNIITAYENYQAVVDISGYNVYEKTDKNKLKQVMTEVINETPYLFYAGQEYTKEIASGTSQVKRIVLSYSEEYTNYNGSVNITKIKNTRNEINSEVNSVMKNITNSMNDVEKAMVLHDYIVENTSYSDKRTDKNRVSEAGVFIDHKANCQGYSLAYGILLQKAGIDVRYIVSEKMGHMWNLVRIGKSWYNVDVTWDDPVDVYSGSDQYSLVMHNYFLKSTGNFKANGHYGFKAKQASSVKFDNMYWKDVTSSFYYRNGKWIYMGDDGILERKKLVSGTPYVLFSVNGRAFARFNNNKYYFIAGNSIYIYSRQSGRISMVWRTSDYYSPSYYLSQIMYSEGRVYYRLLKNKKYIKGSFNVNNNGIP